eukprot:Skav208746  [mRNA]  locus=scaffold742:495054:496244:- [translate_table: standard]
MPDHPVFQLASANLLNLSTCVPTILHGDEGRGRKRTAFLVMNWHSVIGRGLSTSKESAKRQYCKLLPNYEGHSLTSRFLFAALPKLLYTGSREYVFHSLLELVQQEARDLLYNGVQDSLGGRGKFTFALLHISGDWPWLTDSGYLLRSYRNVQKHKTQRRDPVGICHLCRAGQTNYHFEELNTHQPRWRSTMHSQDLHGEYEPSPLARLPHCPGKLGLLWFFDVFHCWHLGVGKYFLSSFIALLSGLQPEGSVDDRFESLTGLYLRFCKERKKASQVSKLTKELVGWTSTTVYPSGGWHKGALTTVLMDWVECRYHAEGSGWSEMRQMAGEAAANANSFLRTLYKCNIFLTRQESKQAGDLCLTFLKLYSRLARQAVQSGKCLWVLQPKHHALHHL